MGFRHHQGVEASFLEGTSTSTPVILSTCAHSDEDRLDVSIGSSWQQRRCAAQACAALLDLEGTIRFRAPDDDIVVFALQSLSYIPHDLRKSANDIHQVVLDVLPIQDSRQNRAWKALALFATAADDGSLESHDLILLDQRTYMSCHPNGEGDMPSNAS
ncbi:hypothetical protein CBOM_04055 [Ceraceosorus bombacis]|uniref:Uncharacterized protein n=1 Tax=Ceraceosorus bombacis TaxID=401625 RepID=A0A0P1BNY9_9BASI|nr:hypothetical protein CBOM_04055 [Ceraceosorus bombacis]